MAIAGLQSTKLRHVPLVVMILLEAALLICWSAGFVGVRFALGHGSIFLLLFWRSLASAVLLLPLVAIMGRKLSWRDVLYQAVLGALGMAGYLAGFASAIGYGVPTGLVALVADMLPLAVALLSWPVLGQGLSAKQWSGSFLGLTGVLIASGWSVHATEAPVWSYALPLLGTVSLALATLLQKRKPSTPMPLFQSLCIQCFSASIIFAAITLYQGRLLPVLDAHFIGGVFWLVFVATFGGYGLYYLALRTSSATRVTTILYLSPPLTMIWAWLVFDEPLSWGMAVGLVVSLLGVVVVAKSTQAIRA